LKGLLVLFLLFAAAAPAASRAACAPDSAVVIYYGNGMYISPARARVQALLMDRKLRPSLPSGTKVTFAYSYNNSEEDVTQVLQVISQAFDDKAIQFQSWINKPSSAPSWARSAIKAAEQNSRESAYVNDPDLKAHVAKYKADLAAGERVIVLAHSQGNFYANRAYADLPSKAGFGIVSVGTPANATADGGPYTTLTNDKIIEPIPYRRAPNTTNGAGFVAAAADADGHSFTRSYLNGDVSGPQIAAQVNARLAALSCPAGP
jgi:hypothetical protein